MTIRHHGEEVARVLTAMVVDIMRRFGWVNRHRVVCTLKPALDVQRLPGAGRLVLGNTIGIFPWMTKRRLVQYPRLCPPMFTSASCTARPIVALARQPGPNTLCPLLTCSACTMGPFKMSKGVDTWVEHNTPRKLKRVSSIASSAVRITGIYSGKHPAITAFVAMRSTGRLAPCGGNSAMTRWPPAQSARPWRAPWPASVAPLAGRRSSPARSTTRWHRWFHRSPRFLPCTL